MQKEEAEKRLKGFDPREIFEKAPGLQPGTADMIVGGETLQVICRMAASYLGAHDGLKRYFRKILVIAPPELVWDVPDEAIHAALIKGIEDIHSTSIDTNSASKLLAMVEIVRCERLDISEVLDYISAAGEKHIVLVPKAEKYRDHTLLQSWALGRAGALFPEDVWAPHAARLATLCLAAARPQGSIIVFSVSGESLVRDENIQLLTDVEDLYPVILGYKGEPNHDSLFATLAPRWMALATAGRAEQAFAELEQSDLNKSVKQQVALQLAVRAGDTRKALEFLRKYENEIGNFPGEMLARLGKMAYTSGDTPLALTFFEASLGTLSDQMWLEATLATLTSMRASVLVENCWNRLQSLFPQSRLLEENREYRLLQICHSDGTAHQFFVSRAGFDDFHNYFADALTQNNPLDYDGLFEGVCQRWPDRTHLASLCIALHSFTRQDLPIALHFAMLATKSVDYEPRAVGVLARALQRMLLLEVHPAGDMDVYKVPLLFVLRYLARHPDEARLRSEVSSALSVEMAGSIGLPIMASIALNLIALGSPLLKLNQPEIRQVSDDEFTAFFERAIIWMSEQNFIEPGVTQMPREIIENDVDGLIAHLNKSMQFSARNLETTEELELFEKMAYVVCLLQPYSSSPSADLNALRLFGAKLCLQGQPQRARDIAEQVLSMAGDSSVRKRIAWSGYADIYNRTFSPVEALIGLTCAAISEAEVEPSDLFQEAYTLLRVARDLQLFDVARAVLPSCRKLYAIDGLGELGEQRLDGIELGLDVAQSGDLAGNELLSLLERTRIHCENVISGTDELTPAASQFLQVAGRIERAGRQLPPEALALRTVLKQKLGAETASFLNAVSAAFPTPDEVVWLHNRLGAASNSDDTSSDQRSMVMAAHRLLLPQTSEISAADAALAVELLSDRGLEVDSATHVLERDWPAKYAVGLSLQGVSVMMLATDSDGEVVVVVAENGSLKLTRPDVKKRNFVGRLNAWSTTYPYRYGFIEREEGNIEFYNSMEEFILPMPTGDNVLIVAEPILQQLAFNILLVNHEFAGKSKAIGLAPSLTWFNNARRRPGKKKNERVAWISCSPEMEAYGTLEMLFARLSPVFDKHGIRADMSGKIPEDVRGTSLAIVTAHGGLSSEKRYIHTIADEQDLTESPLSLARALAGVDVVILFVCSGGRVDRHPLSNTTVSLPKMLLDRGCRAVLASPWPLDAVVPGNWLEQFMEAWESGDTILQANYKGNLNVQERLGPEAGLALAMTAYGDVMLTKSMTT